MIYHDDWNHLGTILGSFLDRLVTILGPLWDHLGTMLGHFEITLGPSWDHVGIILGPSGEHARTIVVSKTHEHHKKQTNKKTSEPSMKRHLI